MNDLIIGGAKGIPDGLYVIKDGELFKYKPKGGTVRSYHITDRPRGEQYKKGFEDAKRAFLVEYARESENMRKRNAQLEVMLNAQKAISADRPKGKWKSVKASIYPYGYDVECSVCGHKMGSSFGYKYCPNCGSDNRERSEDK